MVFTVKTVNVRLHVLALMRVACGGEVVEPHLLSCRTLDVATIFATCFACNSRFSFCDFATEKLSSLKLFHCLDRSMCWQLNIPGMEYAPVVKQKS